MATVFKVGKRYDAYGSGIAQIEILRRTENTIWVDNGECQWRMKIRHAYDGSEYAVDCSVPKAWRDTFTYQSW